MAKKRDTQATPILPASQPVKAKSIVPGDQVVIRRTVSRVIQEGNDVWMIEFSDGPPPITLPGENALDVVKAT